MHCTLRSGYEQPTEKISELKWCGKKFKDEVVCLLIDGWTNVNNSLVLVFLQFNGDVVLVDTENTSGLHDSIYLYNLTWKLKRHSIVKLTVL